ncbi:DUF4157 domain-containing protein [Chloroflexia bacterium SDU3-3]|nr:DUF4157 domain-containing protein [Chloroflexia bacterium SDU3-3]
MRDQLLLSRIRHQRELARSLIARHPLLGSQSSLPQASEGQVRFVAPQLMPQMQASDAPVAAMAAPLATMPWEDAEQPLEPMRELPVDFSGDAFAPSPDVLPAIESLFGEPLLQPDLPQQAMPPLPQSDLADYRASVQPPSAVPQQVGQDVAPSQQAARPPSVVQPPSAVPQQVSQDVAPSQQLAPSQNVPVAQPTTAPQQAGHDVAPSQQLAPQPTTTPQQAGQDVAPSQQVASQPTTAPQQLGRDVAPSQQVAPQPTTASQQLGRDVAPSQQVAPSQNVPVAQPTTAPQQAGQDVAPSQQVAPQQAGRDVAPSQQVAPQQSSAAPQADISSAIQEPSAEAAPAAPRPRARVPMGRRMSEAHDVDVQPSSPVVPEAASQPSADTGPSQQVAASQPDVNAEQLDSATSPDSTKPRQRSSGRRQPKADLRAVDKEAPTDELEPSGELQVAPPEMAQPSTAPQQVVQPQADAPAQQQTAQPQANAPVPQQTAQPQANAPVPQQTAQPQANAPVSQQTAQPQAAPAQQTDAPAPQQVAPQQADAPANSFPEIAPDVPEQVRKVMERMRRNMTQATDQNNPALENRPVSAEAQRFMERMRQRANSAPEQPSFWENRPVSAEAQRFMERMRQRANSAPEPAPSTAEERPVSAEAQRFMEQARQRASEPASQPTAAPDAAPVSPEVQRVMERMRRDLRPGPAPTPLQVDPTTLDPDSAQAWALRMQRHQRLTSAPDEPAPAELAAQQPVPVSQPPTPEAAPQAAAPSAAPEPGSPAAWARRFQRHERLNAGLPDEPAAAVTPAPQEPSAAGLPIDQQAGLAQSAEPPVQAAQRQQTAPGQNAPTAQPQQATPGQNAPTAQPQQAAPGQNAPTAQPQQATPGRNAPTAQPQTAPTAQPQQAAPAPSQQASDAGPIANALAGVAPTPLRETTRRFLQPILGFDPGDVPVYRGPQAAQLAASYQAEALTDQQSVVIGGNESETAPRAMGLLAHELTHVARGQNPRFVPPTPRVTRQNAVAANEETIARSVEADVAAAAQIYNQQPSVASTQPTSTQRLGQTVASTPNDPAIPAMNIRGQQPGAATPSSRTPTDWGNLPAPWEPLPTWLDQSFAQPADQAAPQPQAPSQPDRSTRTVMPSAPPAPAIAAPAANGAGQIQLASEEGHIEAAKPATESSQSGGDSSVAQPDVDLDTLARQVYSALKQRLAAERRRGGGW